MWINFCLMDRVVWPAGHKDLDWIGLDGQLAWLHHFTFLSSPSSFLLPSFLLLLLLLLLFLTNSHCVFYFCFYLYSFCGLSFSPVLLLLLLLLLRLLCHSDAIEVDSRFRTGTSPVPPHQIPLFLGFPYV